MTDYHQANRFDVTPTCQFEVGGASWRFCRYRDLPLGAEQGCLQTFFADAYIMAEYLPGVLPSQEELADLPRFLANWDDGKTCLLFAILSEADHIVALVNFDSLEEDNNQGEIGIAIVTQEMRGKGFSYHVLREAVQMGYDLLGLHRIWARVSLTNAPSLKLFRQSGFVQEGILRECRRRQNAYDSLAILAKICPN